MHNCHTALINHYIVLIILSAIMIDEGDHYYQKVTSIGSPGPWEDLKIWEEGARSDRSSFDGTAFCFLIGKHMGVQFRPSGVFDKTCFKGGNLKFVNLKCYEVKNV